MTVTSIDWSTDGKLLAVAGRGRKSVAKPEGGAQLMIYSPYGRQEFLMRFEYNMLSAVSWDATGSRLVVLHEGSLTFLTIKNPLKVMLKLKIIQTKSKSSVQFLNNF